MNNAFQINETLKEESVQDTSPLLQKRVEELTDVIEALLQISGSSYWKVLENNVFNVELSKSKRKLETEKDTTEMFRLQGEIRVGNRYNLDKLIVEKRNELQIIKGKIT